MANKQDERAHEKMQVDEPPEGTKLDRSEEEFFEAAEYLLEDEKEIVQV